jgi:putative phosphoesterase
MDPGQDEERLLNARRPLPPIYRLAVPESGIARIGVLADTHIPDRLKALPAALFEVLEGVDLILHAGDISQPRVLDELRRLAPVVAVQGNRDLFNRAGRGLPLDVIVEVGSLRIGMTHGHGGLAQYVKEKLAYLTVGYYFSHYHARVRERFADVHAIVFGHTHYPINQIRQGVLLFNPGAVGPDYKTRYGPSAGRITVDTAHNRLSGEVLPLVTR